MFRDVSSSCTTASNHIQVRTNLSHGCTLRIRAATQAEGHSPECHSSNQLWWRTINIQFQRRPLFIGWGLQKGEAPRESWLMKMKIICRAAVSWRSERPEPVKASFVTVLRIMYKKKKVISVFSLLLAVDPCWFSTMSTWGRKVEVFFCIKSI